MKLTQKDLVQLITAAAGAVFGILAFGLFGAPFVAGKFIGSTESGFALAFNFDSGKNAGTFIAFLLALLLLLDTVGRCAVFFLLKFNIVKVKVPQTGKTFEIAYLAVSLVAYLIGAILIFLTPTLFDVDGLYSLGGGAITSGIFVIFADLLLVGGRAYSAFAK